VAGKPATGTLAAGTRSRHRRGGALTGSVAGLARVPNAPDPQAAFQAAGGLEAWQGMHEASADLAAYRPASVAQCPDAPVSP
jgi:hypothetical protein